MEWKADILTLLQWVESQGRGTEAILWIIGLEALLVMLLIPGPFFTMAAGFLLGIKWGFAAALCGSTLGSALAYGIGRYLFPTRKRPEATRRRWIVTLEQFVREGGWKIVMSTRLIPIFPFKLSNYFFGWMRFPFRPFLLGTFLGIIPMTAVSVAAGSVLSDLATVLQPGKSRGGQWPLSLAGLGLALVLFTYAGYQSRKKMKELNRRAV